MCSAPASLASCASAPPRETATSFAPLPTALVAMETVSSVSPEYDTANASVRGPTNAGVRICFSTVIGTGTSSLNAADTTSPEIPEPPMPSTTMLRIASAFGSALVGTDAAASCAAASCSGNPATASRKFKLSVKSLLETGFHAVGFGLLGEARGFGVVDGLGVVDEEIGDVAV